MTFDTVTVYTSPSCGQCTMTKRWLSDRDIPFKEVDLSTDREALDAVLELGYKQAPVVVARHADKNEDDNWYGFNPIKLKAFADSWNHDMG